MPKRLPDPTEAELTILHVLWRRGPSTVREVWHELGEKSGYTTVLKFLQIMRDKGLVRRDNRGTSHVYAAAASEADTKKKLVTRLMDRVFGGSATDLVMGALAAKPIPPEELKAIRELIAQAEQKKP